MCNSTVHFVNVDVNTIYKAGLFFMVSTVHQLCNHFFVRFAATAAAAAAAAVAIDDDVADGRTLTLLTCRRWRDRCRQVKLASPTAIHVDLATWIEDVYEAETSPDQHDVPTSANFDASALAGLYSSADRDAAFQPFYT